MRYLFIALVAGGLGVGCATPKVSAPPQVSVEVERWQQRYQEERERAEALAMRLAEVESALEAAAQERAESEQLSHLLEDELERAQAERHSLVEHNAQLVNRQRELTELQELQQELEDVWFKSALSRARRRSQPQPAQPPAAQEQPPQEANSSP
ncbi:hypothetical protein [Archangium minus]|uniref:hypothetical protein n=1 Tax=Archangium TaxID=47 RepID=UPI0037C1945B